jgi:hypothetical protein
MCLRFQFCTHQRVCILYFLKKSQIRCTLNSSFIFHLLFSYTTHLIFGPFSPSRSPFFFYFPWSSSHIFYLSLPLLSSLHSSYSHPSFLKHLFLSFFQHLQPPSPSSISSFSVFPSLCSSFVIFLLCFVPSLLLYFLSSFVLFFLIFSLSSSLFLLSSSTLRLHLSLSIFCLPPPYLSPLFSIFLSLSTLPQVSTYISLFFLFLHY